MNIHVIFISNTVIVLINTMDLCWENNSCYDSDFDIAFAAKTNRYWF